MKKAGLDKEMIIALGVAAAIISITILFTALFFLNIDATGTAFTKIIILYFAMTSFIWCFLLCRNC